MGFRSEKCGEKMKDGLVCRSTFDESETRKIKGERKEMKNVKRKKIIIIKRDNRIMEK